MRHPAKKIPIKSISVSLDDIRRIFERLHAHVMDEGTREISALKKPEDKPQEQFDAEMADLKSRAFRITVTVGGRDGGSLFGDDGGIFSSPNLPDQIAFIFMTNVVAYEGVASQKPSNQFSLYLDFSKPPLIDVNTFVSSPTPNSSNLEIEGDNDAWVAAIFEAVDGILRNRRTRRSLVHKGFAYDVGVFILGLPFAFWLCAKLSTYVTSNFGGA